MFYDLNVRWTPNDAQLPRTLAFLSELGYNVVALNHIISGKLPVDLTCPIPSTFPEKDNVPASLTVLRRVTLTLTESYQNARLTALAREYDMLAVRPIDERTLQLACSSLECDIISLDLTQRLNFHFKYKSFAEAIKAGKRFEICYAQALASGDPQARRNLISNATQLIRATRGRGIILSSEASHGPVGCRGPWDIINLTTLWGLSQERGHEGVTKEARGVVVTAKLKKTGWRGVIDVINPGEKPDAGPASEVPAAGKKQSKKQGGGPTAGDGGKQQKKRQQQHQQQNAAQQTSGQKRKADTLSDVGDSKALAQRGLHTAKHAKQ